jgi:amino acid transporter
MAGRRRWPHLALILTAIIVLYFVAPVSLDADRSTVARVVVAAIVIVLLAVGVVWQLRLHIDDTSRRLDGLIIAIVMVMAVFSFSFFAVEERDPAQFDGLETRLDALYFSTSTAVTVGFGDVHATGQVGRGLVLVNMVFNVVLVGSAVALVSTRLRAAAQARGRAQSTDPSAPGGSRAG